MEQLTGTDIFVIAVLLISGLLSLSRGFVSEMLGIGAWFVAASAGFYLMPYLAPYLSRYISNPLFANLAAVIIASLLTLVVLTILCSKITIKVKKSVLNRLDHFLGLMFGLLRGLIILVLMYFIVLTLAPKKLPDLREDSLTMPYLETVTDSVKGQLPESLFDTPTKKDDGESNLDELFEKLNDMKEIQGKPKKKKAPVQDLSKPVEIIPVDPFTQEPMSEKPVAPESLPDEGEELFKLLNAPEVTEQSGGEETGYDRQEREDMERLIMESIDETGSVVP